MKFVLVQLVVPLFGLAVVQFIWNLSQSLATGRARPLWVRPEPTAWLYVALLWSWQAAVAFYAASPGLAATCVGVSLFSIFLLVAAIDERRRHDEYLRSKKIEWTPPSALRLGSIVLVIVAALLFAKANLGNLFTR